MTLIKDILSAPQLVNYMTGEEADRKKEYLDELTEYTLDGTYTTNKHKSYLLRNYFKPHLEQAKALDLSKAAIWKYRKQLNTDLAKRVGDDIVERIIEGDFEHVDRVFAQALVEQPIDTILIPDIIERLKEDKIKRYEQPKFDLEDCVLEMKLLKRYTHISMEVLLSKVDNEKLQYLVRLLNFEESDALSRSRLLEVLKGAHSSNE